MQKRSAKVNFNFVYNWSSHFDSGGMYFSFLIQWL
jgi:hypothetical protein